MKLIELNNASKYYLNKTFNLKVNKHELLLVTGTNGSGKTTLIKLILGFIKPDNGKITYYKDIKFNYLPEKTSLPYFLTSYDYLYQISKLKNVSLNLKLLVDLDIPLYKKIAHLSKGNYQRVAIASTFIGNSDLIILDEPLSGLDTKTVNTLKRIIIKLKEEGKSIIISTHNPKVFEKLATYHIKLWLNTFSVISLIKKWE